MNADITKVSREDLEQQYMLVSSCLACLLKRLGGKTVITDADIDPNDTFRRLWYGKDENGDLMVELRYALPEEIPQIVVPL